MSYAKYKDAPLPAGSAHLRINHVEINYPFKSVPMITFSIERRTELGDGTTFGEQLESIQIALEGKAAQFDVIERVSGVVKNESKPLNIDELSDILFSAGRFALNAWESVIAEKAVSHVEIDEFSEKDLP